MYTACEFTYSSPAVQNTMNTDLPPTNYNYVYKCFPVVNLFCSLSACVSTA